MRGIAAIYPNYIQVVATKESGIKTLADLKGKKLSVGAPYIKAKIPANTYTGQTQEVEAAAVVNYLVTRSDLADDLVYNMTKSIFDNLPELVASHSAGKDIALARALDGMPVPLHPGTEKYFREKGLVK